MAKPILESIQAGRGMAALMVLFVHINLPVLGKVWGAGVDFFFVLSGFIIFYVHHQDFGNPKKIGTYLYRRFVRIYPVYWLIIGGYWGLHYLLGNDWKDFYQANTLGVIQTILLLPDHPLVVLTSWTLSYEIIFYLVVLLRFVFKSGFAFYCLLLFPLLAVVGVHLLPPSYAVYPTFLGEALLGTLVFSFYQYRLINFTAIFVGLFCGIFLLIFLPYFSPMSHPLITRGFPCGLILFALVGWEKRQKVQVPRFFLMLGNASYILYLTHTIVLATCTAFISGVFSKMPTPFTTGLSVVIAVVLAIAGHYWVEKPLLRFLRKARSDSSSQVK